ncbi:glycosyltransferase family 2 protein [uncultured Umboniibacter sp.]|uniref:glycosyltransferase family 2 protein n=1 Tax=uncultured Umboniibacter sp. TaxID=1798917 RepID=UPI00261750CF|nr:glycosyltransferase family 2 protein [uncultured Umboniibacter sp.]
MFIDVHSKFIEVVANSGLFDQSFYEGQVGQTFSSQQDAIASFGAKSITDNYMPNRLFSPLEYVQLYPDVIMALQHPFFHYIQFGRHAGNRPGFNFKPSRYARELGVKLPDVLGHALEQGLSLSESTETIGDFTVYQNNAIHGWLRREHLGEQLCCRIADGPIKSLDVVIEKTGVMGAISGQVATFHAKVPVIDLLTEAGRLKSTEVTLLMYRGESTPVLQSELVVAKKDLITTLLEQWEYDPNFTLKLLHCIDIDLISALSLKQLLAVLSNLVTTKLYGVLPHREAVLTLSVRHLESFSVGDLRYMFKDYFNVMQILAPHVKGSRKLVKVMLELMHQMDPIESFLLSRQLRHTDANLSLLLPKDRSDSDTSKLFSCKSVTEQVEFYHTLNETSRTDIWPHVVQCCIDANQLESLTEFRLPRQFELWVVELEKQKTSSVPRYQLLTLLLSQIQFMPSISLSMIIIDTYLEDVEKDEAVWLGASELTLAFNILNHASVMPRLEQLINLAAQRDWVGRGGIIRCTLNYLNQQSPADAKFPPLLNTALMHFGLCSDFLFGLSEVQMNFSSSEHVSACRAEYQTLREVLNTVESLQNGREPIFKLIAIMSKLKKTRLAKQSLERFCYGIYLYARQHYNARDMALAFGESNSVGHYDKLLLLSESNQPNGDNVAKINGRSKPFVSPSLQKLYRRTLQARRDSDETVLEEIAGVCIELRRQLGRGFDAPLSATYGSAVRLYLSELIFFDVHRNSAQFDSLVSSALDVKLLEPRQAVEVEIQIALVSLESKEDCEASSLTFVSAKAKSVVARSIEARGIKQTCQYLRQRIIFPYTCVLVYSCQAYQSTRQKVLAESWVAYARASGIDVRFVMGGTKESFHDDQVIYLDVEDNYESLPQKSLAMYKYVQGHIGALHFYKIDDDCLLNVDAHFSDPVFFSFDYWGRRLKKGIGDVDRDYHQNKSTSAEARNALDLSPEESVYADGGTSYSLSRHALNQLLAASTEHASLVSRSFYEDKLIGDLLATKDIVVSDEGMRCVVRRILDGAIEGYAWEYNIYPSSENNIRILHSESPQHLAEIWQQNFVQADALQRELGSKIISNQKIDGFKLYTERGVTSFLEELRVTNELKHAQKVAVIVAKDESTHLGALLAHHRSIGFEQFIYIDNGSKDGSLEFMLEQQGVSILTTSLNYRESRYSVEWVDTALMNYCIGKWTLVIDADEFFTYQGFEDRTIDTLIAECEGSGAQAVFAALVDFYSDGPLVEADLSDRPYYQVLNHFDSQGSLNIRAKASSIYGQAPVLDGGVRARVFGHPESTRNRTYANQKVCFFRFTPELFLTEGLHEHFGRRLSDVKCALMHFKFHSEFGSKVQKQLKAGQHWNGSIEYKIYMSVLQSSPNLSLFDSEVSRMYHTSQDLVDAGYLTNF